jgi:hypothetical protein
MIETIDRIEPMPDDQELPMMVAIEPLLIDWDFSAFEDYLYDGGNS